MKHAVTRNIKIGGRVFHPGEYMFTDEEMNHWSYEGLKESGAIVPVKGRSGPKKLDYSDVKVILGQKAAPAMTDSEMKKSFDEMQKKHEENTERFRNENEELKKINEGLCITLSERDEEIKSLRAKVFDLEKVIEEFKKKISEQVNVVVGGEVAGDLTKLNAIGKEFCQINVEEKSKRRK